MPDWATTWAIVAVAVLPTAKLGELLLVFLGKRLGVEPKEIEDYQAATEGESDENVSE